MQRLQEKGVIAGGYYAINVAYFQIRSYRILLALSSRTPELLARVDDFARTHPHIIQSITLVGAWDYELLLEVYSPEHHNDVLDQISQFFGNSLNSIRSLQIFKRHKVSHYPLELR